MTSALAAVVTIAVVTGGLAHGRPLPTVQAAPASSTRETAPPPGETLHEPEAAPEGPTEHATDDATATRSPGAPGAPSGPSAKESRLILKVSPPTGVSLRSDHLGLTTTGTPRCNVSNCRLLIATSDRPLLTAYDEVPVGTSPWPSWWAEGTTRTLYFHSWGRGWGWTKTHWNTSYRVTRPVTTPLTARIASQDDAARSAVIAGTATTGARVEIGGRSTPVSTTGTWSLRVDGLSVGTNRLTAVQKIGTTQLGASVTVTVTIAPQVTPGLVRQVDASPQELARGDDTAVAVAVEFTERTRSAPGTVTVTAPAGTTFATGQGTLAAQYRGGDSTTWQAPPAAAAWGLRDGRRSADGKTYTYTFPGTGSVIDPGTDIRWAPQVSTPLDARVSTPDLGLRMTGALNDQLYDVTGAVRTPITAAPLTAEVTSVDPIARSAVVEGTATRGARVEIADRSAAADPTTGAWSITVTGLAPGENRLSVVQKVGGVQAGDPVIVSARVGTLDTTLGAHAVTVTSDAGGVFTAGTRGTVSIETQAPSDQSGVTVAPGGSFSYLTTVPAGYEAFDLPPAETGPVWRVEHVAGTDPEGRGTVRITVTNISDRDAVDQFADSGTRAFPIRATTAPAADAPISTEFTPPAGYTSSAPRASGVVEAPEAVTAVVMQVNNIAKTVVVRGTGTPGQAVVAAGVGAEISRDGDYQLTAPFTGAGELGIPVEQTIGGAPYDEVTATFVAVEGGTLVGVDSPRQILERGAVNTLPVIVQNDERREDTVGTVTMTAPTGTTFTAQTTAAGSWRPGTSGPWRDDPDLALTGGQVSADGTRITFDLPLRAVRPADEQFRYLVDIDVPRTAEARSSALTFVYEGVSVQGDFRASGTSATRVVAVDPSSIGG
jgi:hypothetical protein